jgi:hypothetical protein
MFPFIDSIFNHWKINQYEYVQRYSVLHETYKT